MNQKEFKKEAPHSYQLFVLMCKVIDVGPDTVDLNNERWYCKHTWSQDDYEKWFDKAVDYVKDNREAQREIMRVPSNDTERIKAVLGIDTIGSWAWDYGWKMDENWDIRQDNE